MAYGKTIELFLVNGTADSLVTAELSNWNGKAIKIRAFPLIKWVNNGNLNDPNLMSGLKAEKVQ